MTSDFRSRRTRKQQPAVSSVGWISRWPSHYEILCHRCVYRVKTCVWNTRLDTMKLLSRPRRTPDRRDLTGSPGLGGRWVQLRGADRLRGRNSTVYDFSPANALPARSQSHPSRQGGARTATPTWPLRRVRARSNLRASTASARLPRAKFGPAPARKRGAARSCCRRSRPPRPL